MLFDVVQEVQAQVETFVSSRLKQVEGEADELKRDSKALSEDVDERLGKLQQQYALDSVLESVLSGYASTLKEWTGKTSATVVYDSKVDLFTHDGLFDAVKGRPNVAVIGFTTDGDVFGGFYSVAVTEQEESFDDPNMFAFSFESHGRCMTPQRFVVKDRLKEEAKVSFWKRDENGFVELGVNGEGGFCLGNEKSASFCCDMSCAFEGLENTTLTGQNCTSDKGPFHHCTRLVAVRLE